MEPQIANPLGAYGNTASPAGMQVVDFNNQAAAARVTGDVVVLSGTGGVNVATTTTANSFLVVGVVSGTGSGPLGAASDATSYAIGAVMPVVIQGPARINIGANTVAANDVLTTSTTAGVAQTNTATTVATASGTLIGIALEASTAKDANNTIRAWIQKM
jgi:hypothetical protein